MARINYKIAGLILLLLVSYCDGKLELPALLSDNMIIQNNVKAVFWGWSEPNECITVNCPWSNRQFCVKSNSHGEWKLKIPTPSQEGPFTITVKSASEERKIRNVMIGEVWLCSGQSNMEWPVKKLPKEVLQAENKDYPCIRFFTVARATSAGPESKCKGEWKVCTPASIADFSAVGYYFGRQIYDKLYRPVGLINSSWGGTPAQAWMSEYALYEDAEIQPFRDVASDERPQHFRESRLFNAMINPLTPFVIKGVIWYQGESNAGNAWQYRELFPALIRDWRKYWGGDMPFYFVQLANYYGNVPDKTESDMPPIGAPSESAWAELRETQLLTYQNVPDTGMAVAIDIGEPFNIHPKNKQEVGRRLAAWALNKDYGFKEIEACGPIYKDIKIHKNEAYIYFSNAKQGLKCNGEHPKGFAIAGQDRIFLWANAVIQGSVVKVWSGQICEPVAVRYGWSNWTEANLFSVSGLPVAPFRTDNWPLKTQPK